MSPDERITKAVLQMLNGSADEKTVDDLATLVCNYDGFDPTRERARGVIRRLIAAFTSARPEERTIEQRWREWVNEGDVTEDAVRAGAKVIAASPLIDAPKLSHNEWMGLSRSILEAAFAVSPPPENR